MNASAQRQKFAESSASIQCATHLLQEGIRDTLREKVNWQKKEEFCESLRTLQRNVDKILPDPAIQSRLLSLIERAINIKGEYFQQSLDSIRFERDIECLAKLAALLELTKLSEQILEFLTKMEPDSLANDWETLKKEGNQQYKNEQWTDAIVCYSRAIRINLYVPILYSNRALCEMQLGKFELALEDAEDAISLDPGQVKFYRIQSEALVSLSRFEHSVTACEKGLNIDPNDETLQLRLRDCQAQVLNKMLFESENVKDRHVYRIIDEFKKPESAPKMLSNYRKHVSEVSPRDLCPMNQENIQTALEVARAHLTLNSNRGNIQEERKCFEIYKSTAERGNAEGLFNMAIMYRDGKAGLPCDAQKAFKLCMQAAQHKPYIRKGDFAYVNPGVADAEDFIGFAYREGTAVEKDDRLAFEWFSKAAQHGYPLAMNHLGLALANGFGCSKDVASAREWYQKSADLGQPEALFNLALMLINGEGGPVDTTKATELLKAASDKGFPGALAALQELMRSGCKGAKSMAASGEIVQEKASKQDKEALFLLGINYLQGEGGFRKDSSKAEECLRRASSLKHKEADYALGFLLHRQGRDKEAIEFLTSSAEDENKDAQKCLGILLAIGHGCTRDVSKARYWLNRSNAYESKAQVDDVINHSADIIEFEAANNLSHEDMTHEERVIRYSRSSKYVPGKDSKDFIGELLKFCQHDVNNPRHPAGQTTLEKLAHPEMSERAKKGSKTAKNYFVALEILQMAHIALNNKNTTKAFRFYRQARRVWDVLPIEMVTWNSFYALAIEAFDKNPRDADALYVILCYKASQNLCSFPEMIRMAAKCIELKPDVADFYQFLCCIYAYTGDFQSGLSSIERALEIEWVPEWLYDRASSMRLLGQQDHIAVIKAYEEFIATNEPDNRKIPESYYCIAFEYFNLGNEVKAREYFQKGLLAESPEVRLPCFEPLTEFPPKNLLQIMLKFSHLKPTEQGKAKQSPMNRCGNCGKGNAPSQCSRCKKVKYCDRSCQQKHWKEHKENCGV